MQTAMTHLGGVGRRDKIEYYAGQCRLVGDKLPQLEKGPTVTAAAFRLRSPFLIRAFPDARITWENDKKGQGIVDSWPADVDDSAARHDWGFSPAYDFQRAFRDYLIPTIRKRYGK